MNTDNAQLADELDAKAEAKEAEALQLRAAAAILRGNGPGPSVVVPGKRATETDTARPGAARWISEVDYLQTIQSQPGKDWTADALAEELARLGKPVASIDAVRTALVRLSQKGHVTRVGYGRYKLAMPAIAGGAAS